MNHLLCQQDTLYSSQVLISRDEFDILVFCAFRYALGRHTYIVDDVANLILYYKSQISENTKALIIKEIREELAMQKGSAFESTDDESWDNLLFELTKEQS